MHDYPLKGIPRLTRSAMYRSGLLDLVGSKVWTFVSDAPYISKLHSISCNAFEKIPVAFSEIEYHQIIGPDSKRNSMQEEYVLRADGCWIEPNRCLVVSDGREVLSQSKGHPNAPLYPSLHGYIARERSFDVGAAVVYDGFASKNYYHHLVDRAMAFKMILEEGRVDRAMPFLVSEWIYRSPFFSYLLERNDAIAGLDWRVMSPGRWVRARASFIVRAMPFDPASWRYLRNLYGRISGPRGRRVFLSRDKSKFTRGLDNEDIVEAMLKRHGFEKVYAEHLSLAQQQALFEETECLVALEGMGLIQQFFMEPSTARVLEIIPSSRIQSEYYWQAWTIGVKYFDVVLGSAMNARGTYSVDPKRLEEAVLSMLSHDSGMRRYGLTNLPLRPTVTSPLEVVANHV